MNSEVEPFRDMVATGRLEIYLQGEWGTVCDNRFRIFEAGVACRELGYSFVSFVSNVNTING